MRSTARRTCRACVVPVVLPGTEELALGFLGPNILVDLRPDLERGPGPGRRDLPLSRAPPLA